mgnify:CR=1 FL=1
MKNFFTLFCLLMAASAVNAQILFSQDFENGMAPMTLVDNDGKTPAANVAAYSAAWTVASPTFGNGTKVAISNSWYNPPGAADDWMITPAITITDPNTLLQWEAKAQDGAYPDGYQVRVSKTNTDLTSFTDVIFSIPAELTSWQERGVSLADYVGETIHIAFRNNSNDMFLLLVDNILVSNILERDVAVTKFKTTQFHLFGSDVNIEAEITNFGGQVLNSLDFHWSDGVNTYSETVTDLALAYGESVVLTHGNTFNISQAKSYNISVWADNPNSDTDGFLDNNSINGVVAGVTYIPAKKMFVEEGTGTWCGWCPRGTEWVDWMTEYHPDEFVGVAVHNGDPMVVTEYDNGVGNFPGFTGYPGVIVDRDAVWDPSDLGDILPDYVARIAPVAPGVNAQIDVESKSLTVNATAEFVTQLAGIDYRLNVVLTEDYVKGTGAGYNQVNYYAGAGAPTDPIPNYGLNWDNLPDPVPAAQMEYNHVARAILGGWAGSAASVPADVIAGDVAEKIYTVNNFNTGWNPFNMHAVVMVIDNATGQVLNAESEEIEVICPANLGVTITVVDDTLGTTGTGSIAVAMANPNLGFGGYTFKLNNGATGPNFANLPAGDYTITVSDKIGCSQEFEATVGSFVNSVRDIESLTSFSLTPNPASSVSMLNVSFNKAVDMQVAVLNAAGQVMETAKFDRTMGVQHVFDLANYADGIYLVKVNVGNQVHTERLIIAR